MRTPLVQPAAPPPAATVSEFVVTFAIILAAIVGLLLFDTALARVDARERKVYAAREFKTGQQLMTEGKYGAAIDHLLASTSLDPENPTYTTTLSAAILADGRSDDAQMLLAPLLEREPKEAILQRFDLAVIEQYFPEYAARIEGMIRDAE